MMTHPSASGNEFLNQQFIGGAWRPGGSSRTLDVFDPFTRETVTTFRMANVADVDRAYEAAAEAQKSWAATPPQERRAVFERAWQWVDEHFDELMRFLISEGGSTRLKAAFEISLVSDALRTAAALTSSPVGQLLASPDPEKENRLYYEPIGVLGAIGPFNAPLFLGLRPAAPALALGNSVVLKPNELTPVTGGTLLARMFDDAGLPPGVLNVLVTDIAEIGDSFIEHPIPEVIAFTGSSHTGKHIAEVASRNFKKSVLELGGNSAFLVLDDADLEVAVNAAVFSRFTHSGQICMSANRVIVDEKVYDEFLKRYTEKVSTLPVGDPAGETTIVGPLINPRQAELLEKQIDEALAHGATAAIPPQARAADSGLCTPVVLTDVTVDNPVSRIELFGPAVCVMKSSDDAEAIAIANATPYGLSGAVHTRDLERGIAIARRLHTGMVHVNNSTIADESVVPFGGIGASGNGRLNGEAAIQNFTRTVWISVHHGKARFPY